MSYETLSNVRQTRHVRQTLSLRMSNRIYRIFFYRKVTLDLPLSTLNPTWQPRRLYNSAIRGATAPRSTGPAVAPLSDDRPSAGPAVALSATIAHQLDRRSPYRPNKRGTQRLAGAGIGGLNQIKQSQRLMYLTPSISFHVNPSSMWLLL